ncbi:MAG: CPBP family intramembrane metalloprotease [Acidobacteria bacterium]|nr:MAG: CPBP family intramembrane metalloprotease [Acidobacteriota bacterium]
MDSGSPSRRRSGYVTGGVALAVMLVVLLLGAVQDALGLEVAGLQLLRESLLLDPTVVAVILLSLLLFFRRDEREALPSLQAGTVPLMDLVPLAVAVLGVQVVVDNAWSFLGRWTASPAIPQELAAPLHRLGMGGALLLALAILMLLVPRLRRRLRECAAARRLRSGLYFTVAVLVVVYGILVWVGVLVAGPNQVRLSMPPVFAATALLIVGQAVIALGEEIFYRGILQGEVSRVLVKAGVENPRNRRMLALGAVSLLFALEHVGPGMTREMFLATFLYAFCMSLLFGFLFELTGNLAVCSLAHFFNNLIVLGLGPVLWIPGPLAAFGDGVYLMAFLSITFVFLFLLSQDPSKSLAPIRPRD